MTPDEARVGARVFYVDLDGQRQPGTIRALSTLKYEASVAWDEDEPWAAPSWNPVADLRLLPDGDQP